MTTGEAECGWLYGSAHPAGICSVLCDGSTHLISYNIDPTTWQYLCSRNDGHRSRCRKEADGGGGNGGRGTADGVRETISYLPLKADR